MFLLDKIFKKYKLFKMSSKKAMKLAQKQAYAKHRSNITNSRFGSKKINFTSKVNKKSKKS